MGKREGKPCTLFLLQFPPFNKLTNQSIRTKVLTFLCFFGNPLKILNEYFAGLLADDKIGDVLVVILMFLQILLILIKCYKICLQKYRISLKCKRKYCV